MALYNNNQIREAISGKTIICHPFIRDNINNYSLDITLGNYYYVQNSDSGFPVYNPLDREHVEKYFEGPHKAICHQQWCNLHSLRPLRNIPLEHKIIAIRPNERILVHSHEFIGVFGDLIAEIKCHSRWSHNGIAYSGESNLVKHGFLNRLTLEISNNNKQTILLPVGEKLFFLIFHQAGEDDQKITINDSNLFTKTIAEWSPDKLLPTAYTEKRNNPPSIEGLNYE